MCLPSIENIHVQIVSHTYVFPTQVIFFFFGIEKIFGLIFFSLSQTILIGAFCPSPCTMSADQATGKCKQSLKF